MRGHIQIAGALDLEDASTIINAGADELVLPLGPNLNTPELSEAEAIRLIHQIRQIRETDERIPIMAVTYLKESDCIQKLLGTCGLSRVQLQAVVHSSEIKKLKKSGIQFVIQAICIGEASETQLADRLAELEPFVDAFLFDTCRNGARGATGATHDWPLSARLTRKTQRPVILAGGLALDNVAQAIHQVRPCGVDAHTRLENRAGRKDPTLVSQFVAKAREAFKHLFEQSVAT